MICVRTKLRQSKISGIGLFADQQILKGTVVWRFEPSLDILLSKEEVTKLSEPAQKQFYNYAFLDKTYKKYLLCGDDGRFFNHSEYPNCDDSLQDKTIALKDIDKGEELTVNYRTFYDDFEAHAEFQSFIS